MTGMQQRSESADDRQLEKNAKLCYHSIRKGAWA